MTGAPRRCARRALPGVPPAYVMTAGHDPLVDEGIAYARRLEQEGVRVTHVHIADQMHGFLTMGRFIPPPTSPCGRRRRRWRITGRGRAERDAGHAGRQVGAGDRRGLGHRPRDGARLRARGRLGRRGRPEARRGAGNGAAGRGGRRPGGGDRGGRHRRRHGRGDGGGGGARLRRPRLRLQQRRHRALPGERRGPEDRRRRAGGVAAPARREPHRRLALPAARGGADADPGRRRDRQYRFHRRPGGAGDLLRLCRRQARRGGPDPHRGGGPRARRTSASTPSAPASSKRR